MTSNDPQAGNTELLIQFRPTATPEDRERVRKMIEASLQEVLNEPAPGAITRASDEGALELVSVARRRGRAAVDATALAERVQSDPAVEFAEPNFRYKHQQTASSDPLYLNGNLWGMFSDDNPSAIGPAGTTNTFGSQAEKAWARGHHGARNVYVGVIDEGVQIDHEDLRANIWTNPFDPPGDANNDGNADDDRNGYADDIHGWDFFHNDNSVYDGAATNSIDSHGTHVAGTIGALRNETGVAGVNWSVTIIPAKFLGPVDGATDDAVKAVRYLTDLKTRRQLRIVAINNSWGSVGNYSKSLHREIKRAARAEILFVAAAGNNSIDIDQKNNAFYPACYDTNDTRDGTPGVGYDSVISVTAVDSTGRQWFNYGKKQVDIAGPGLDIPSTLPVNRYGDSSGTSMAAPHVTGALALLAASNPTMRARDLKARLLSSVIKTPSLAGKAATEGRVDVSTF